LPGIIRCPNGHTSETAAKVGGTTSCPACRTEGRGRVSCRVHPATPGAAAAGTAGGELDGLEAAWAAEGPAVRWFQILGDPGGKDCPDCGQPMRWTGARTALICPAADCLNWSVSPGAEQRADDRSAAAERNASRQVALTPAQARAARVQLRAWQDALLQTAARLADLCDPDDYYRAQDQRTAFELGAMLRAYAPEIRAADSETALSEIAREIEAIRQDDRFGQLEAERGIAEARRAQQDRMAQWEAEERGQLEAEDREAERQAVTAEHRQAVTQRRTPQAITTAPTSTAGTAAPTLAALAQRRQQARARQLADKGACGFRHPWAANGSVPAARLYGIQIRDWRGAHLSQDDPSIRACPKHFAAAAAWMTDQGHPQSTYWEL
jgi:hypothetical protein